jgi:hypothetical protein
MPRPPFDPSVPFTRREFRLAGLDERRLRSAEFRSVFHDVHVLASVAPSTLLSARAALKVAGPHAHVSHFTAAVLYDLAAPERPGTHVTVPEGVTRPHTDGVRPHRGNAGSDVVVWRGLRISSPVQTFLDLAGHQGMTLVDLAIVGDRLVAKRLATPAALIATADAWRGRGARLARRVARLVRVGVDSPMETRLRLLIVLAGLPEPTVNLILRHPDGTWRMRLDLSYPDQRVLVEYDGRQHAESSRQWRRDIERRDALERCGWRTVTVTAEGIFDDPADTLRRVLAVLRERRVPRTPSRCRDDWRRHFPNGR